MAFAPALLRAPQDITDVTKASVRGGFVAALLMPVAASGPAIVDSASLDAAHANATGAAHSALGTRLFLEPRLSTQQAEEY